MSRFSQYIGDTDIIARFSFRVLQLRVAVLVINKKATRSCRRSRSPSLGLIYTHAAPGGSREPHLAVAGPAAVAA